MTRFVQALSRREVEAKAESVLRQIYGGSMPCGAIEVEVLLESQFNLHLFIGQPQDIGQTEGVLGAIFFDRREVFVNEGLLGAEGRYRFTLAHELGHWILHQDVVDPMELAWSSLIGQRYRGKGVLCRAGDLSPIEYQANVFAAAFLMPRWTFSSAVNVLAEQMGMQREAAAYVADSGKFDNVVQSIAGQFMVSKEAARRRLTELNLVTIGTPNQLKFSL